MQQSACLATCLAVLICFPGAISAVGSPESGKSAPANRPPAAASDSFPDQGQVCAHVAFPTVAASNSSVARSLDAHAIARAQKLVGKKSAFHGAVAKVFEAPNHGIVILDFDQSYDTALTAVVRPSAYHLLPDLKKLRGKSVFVSGTFTDFRGHPQIEIKALSQIHVIGH